MKKIILAFLLVLFGLPALAQITHAYTIGDFWGELSTDTKEVFGKDAKAFYFRDFLEKDSSKRDKGGISTDMIAWRFLAVGPAWIYTPNTANQIGEFGASTNIRFGRIPLAGGSNVEKWAKARFGDTPQTGGWIDHAFVGVCGTKSITGGGWGFGLSTGVKW